MALAKLEKGCLLLCIQFFRPTQEEEARLPRGHRGWREQVSFSSVLLPLWKPTNNMSTHTLIRALIPESHQFSKKTRHIVVARFPPLKKVGQIAIQLTGLLPRLFLRKRPGGQPST